MVDRADSSAAAMMTSAVYLTLRNNGDVADTLVSAATDAAQAVEIHESRMEDGVMRMRQRDNVEIPAGESVVLAPGGLHVMLIGLTQELTEGDEFDVTLTLTRSGQRSMTVVVRRPE